MTTSYEMLNSGMEESGMLVETVDTDNSNNDYGTVPLSDNTTYDIDTAPESEDQQTEVAAKTQTEISKEAG